MRRSALYLFVGAVATLAVACRDSAVAPARDTQVSTTSLAQSARGRGSATTVLGTIQISPDGGTYHVGDFDVVIPAGAVCDLATTNYGRRYWDDDCTPSSTAVTVNVVAESRRNGVSVSFQPDLRFRPSAGWVVVQTQAYRDLLTSDVARKLSPRSEAFRAFGIGYMPSGTRSLLDEALTNSDRSLVTHVDRNTGIIWRRVKHFSSYLITAGFACMPSTETPCEGDPGSTVGGLLSAADSTLVGVISLESIEVTP